MQGLKSLTLESSVDINTNLVLQLLTTRCKKLASLTLTSSKFRTDLLHEFCYSNAQCLTELKLSKCPIGNTEVAVIGSLCTNLKILDLSDISKVTDEGIRTLFQSVDLAGNDDQDFGKCRILASLNVSGTSVTLSGAKDVISGLSGTLVDFECPFSFVAAFEFLTAQNFQGILKLRKLDFDVAAYYDGDERPELFCAVDFVSTFCPYVRRIAMRYNDASSVTDDAIASLVSRPRCVREVFLFNESESLPLDSGFKFHCVILNQGPNLCDVTLVGVAAVPFSDLVALCPLLENLYLDFNSYTSSSEELTSPNICLLKSFR